MKILRVISSMDPVNGGPCQGIRNSIPALSALGVHNEVVSFDDPNASFLIGEQFPVHALGPARGPYAYCSKFKGWLRENFLQFDVVIIHGVWLYNSFGTYSFWKEIKKKEGKAPKIYLMPHGMLDPYFQKAKDRKLKALRNFFFWQLIEKRVVNGIDGLLFTCEEELLLARRSFRPYRPKAELNVGYGIGKPPQYTEEYKYQFLNQCPALKNKSFWLFLSRIHPKKGVDSLLKAYLRLRKLNPSLPDLVIAGPGAEKPFGQALQKDVTKGFVHFPGMLEGGAKWGAFYCCEVFVLPSHQENFGIAVVEAMACSKAVLVSNKVNIWREIERGGGGMICEDSETGVFEVLQMWEAMSQDQKLAMGEKASAIFQSKYTTEKAAYRMLESI